MVKIAAVGKSGMRIPSAIARMPRIKNSHQWDARRVIIADPLSELARWPGSYHWQALRVQRRADQQLEKEAVRRDPAFDTACAQEPIVELSLEGGECRLVVPQKALATALKVGDHARVEPQPAALGIGQVAV